MTKLLKGPTLWAALLLVLTSGVAAFLIWKRHQPAPAAGTSNSPTLQDTAATREIEATGDTVPTSDPVPRSDLGQTNNQSNPLMPSELAGVTLGMTQSALQQMRQVEVVQPNLLREILPNGGRVLYLLDGDHLGEIQIQSILPSPDAIGPHLEAMNERYGAPRYIRDCFEGHVNRRFIWQQQGFALTDAFLVSGQTVSVTLSITTLPAHERNLRRARCQPVSLMQLSTFPVATL